MLNEDQNIVAAAYLEVLSVVMAALDETNATWNYAGDPAWVAEDLATEVVRALVDEYQVSA